MPSFTKIILFVVTAASLRFVAAAPFEPRGDAACGVHIRRTDDSNTHSVKIYAPDGYPGPRVIGSSGGGNLQDGFSIGLPDMGKGPLYLVVNANDSNDMGVIRFGYGGDIWLSSDPRCSVGGWDGCGGLFDSCSKGSKTQDMDCSFACS